MSSDHHHSTAVQHDPHDDRRLMVFFVLAFCAALVIVVLVVALGLWLREGPKDYTVRPPSDEGRHEVIRRAESQMRNAEAELEGGDNARARLDRDVSRVVIAIQQFALANKGRLPRTLEEAGLSPDDIEPGLRYSYGRTNWRLSQTNNTVLARGN
jgi:hypothetical protein